MIRILACTAFVWLLAACPPASQTPGGGGGGGGGGNRAVGINPDACGQINTTKVGRKLYAFLVASAELDRASTELEGSVHDACRHMAADLGTSTEGDTRALCTRVAQELQANLQVSVKSEKRLVTRYTPPVCHTDVSLTANFAAECEASAAADVDVRCEGQCGGTCSGTCNGTQSSGQCNGTCEGRCSGQCNGYASVNASAECKASAEVHAQTHTECSQPKVEVVQQDVTIVDATKFNKAVAAINDGMPELLRAEKRLEIAGKAVANWVETGGSLVRSAGDLAAQIGEKGLCVGGQLAAILEASAQIQARFQVSIEVTASVSASAGATAQ